nr:YfhO family protein [Lysinibacillus timonensis]
MLKDKSLFSKTIVITMITLIIAIMAHSYYIIQFPTGKLMKGINDGLSQILPFKYFLFENYSAGNIYYSESFGIGGGIFSQLAYYYSTNIFYIILVLLLCIVQFLFGINVNFDTWVYLILPMSIIKMTLIILVSYHYFKFMNMSKKAAYVGAVVYAVSPFFLRHEMYWDFFSDALFWMVLLLIGIEKVIRKESGMLFTIAIACTIINNFYFAYINLLLAIFYILVRWVIKTSHDELGYMNQLKVYSTRGILGFGIGSFAFVPAVIAYLNNFRPDYKNSIPLIQFTDNILLNSRILWLPIFVLIILCMTNLYRSKTFQLFALVSILGTVLHFIPYVGSFFNGFSAPQNRWEAIVVLGYAGVIAYGVDHLKDWKIRQIIVGSVVFTALASLSLLVDTKISYSNWMDYTLLVLSIILVLAYILLIIGKKATYMTFGIVTILFVVMYANIFQVNRLSTVGNGSDQPTLAFMNSNLYNSEEQRMLITEAKAQMQDGARIDWMAYLRNNTPIVQDFNGFSIYSSILNRNILMMYLEDLQIDMGRESVSRYAGLGDRTNLMSLLQVQFYMREKGGDTIPYSFQPFTESDNYVMYKNDNLLPAFRIVDQFISERSLDKAPIIQREHAMLKGAIIDQPSYKETLTIEKPKNLKLVKIQLYNAEMEDELLKVNGNKGGIDLFVTASNDKVKDFYVSFTIEGVKKRENFFLTVNEYKTVRKSTNSIYRTNINDLTVRVEAADKISIRLPKGNYRVSNIEVYEENYETLNNALKQSKEANIKWDNDKVMGSVIANSDNEMVITPIPFEPGWELKINGKDSKTEKVNYSFIGIPLVKGENNIELIYSPPFFKQCLLLSILSVIVLLIISLRNKNKKRLVK